MSTRPTVVVLLLAAIGVVAAFIVGRDQGADPHAAGGGVLLEPHRLPVESVSRITLTRRGGEPMAFERRADGQWWQTEPFEHPMVLYSIRQLIVQATGLSVVRRLQRDEARDPAGLGLHPPEAALGYEWAGGGLTLELGRRSVGGRAYLRVAGEPDVYVVGSALHERAVDMDPTEWRDRRLLAGASAEAERIVLRLDGPRTVLAREGRRWRLLEPVVTRADGQAVRALLDAFGRAEHGGFVAEEPADLSPFGLAEPAGLVEVQTTLPVAGDGQVDRRTQRLRLLVGSATGVAAPDRFGAVEGVPVVVRLPEPVLEAFFPPPAELADPTACGSIAADVGSILIQRADGDRLHLQRDLEDWSAPGREGAVSGAAVGALLELVTMRRAETVELRPFPGRLEVATVSLFSTSGRPMDSVRVAREPGSGRWTLDNGDDVLRIFPPQTVVPLARSDFGL